MRSPKKHVSAAVLTLAAFLIAPAYAGNAGKAIEPHTVESYLARAKKRIKLRDVKGAMADYHKAIELNPKNTHAYTGRGVLRYSLGDKDGALSDFNQAVAIDPKCVKALTMRATVFQSQDKFERALADLNQAITINPKDSSCYYSRGILDFELGKNKAAAADLDKAADLSKPDADNAVFARALESIALRQAKDEAGAKQVIEETMQQIQDGDWPKPILAYLSNSITVTELFSKCTNPDQLTAAHAYVGMDLAAKGKTAQAKVHLQWVMDKGNKSLSEYDEAEAVLHRLVHQSKVSHQ